MVRVLAHELHAPLVFGLLDILDRHVLLAVDIDREQVHVPPEDVLDAAYLLVEHDVAALEQRIHAVAHHVDRTVAAGQVRNVDVVDRAHRLPVQEKRHQPGGSLYIIEGYALRGQSAVGAVREDRLGPLFEKHLPLSGFEPLGINVQFLNNNIFISFRKRCAAGLDHRQRTLPDAQFLGKRLLRQPQLFAYQPQSLPHIEKIFFAIISCKKSTKSKI